MPFPVGTGCRPDWNWLLASKYSSVWKKNKPPLFTTHSGLLGKGTSCARVADSRSRVTGRRETFFLA